MKKIYLIFALLPLAFTAGAQGLNKEITIEKEIVPELRAATRLDVSHNILAPQFRSQQLAVSERDMGVNINPDAAPLVPVYDMNSSKLNRGYLRLGYLPEYNANVSAGYKFLKTDNTTLGAYLNYYGIIYDMDKAEPEDDKVKDHNFDLGLNLAHKFSADASLKINANFGTAYSKYAYELWSGEGFPANLLYKGGNTRFGFDAEYTGIYGDVNYYISGKAGYFKNKVDDDAMPYGLDVPEDYEIEGTAETSFGFAAGVNSGNVGLDISADFLHYNQFNSYSGSYPDRNLWQFVPGDGKTTGIVTARPFYRFVYGVLSANIGVKAELSVNSGDKFHIAPDIRLSARVTKVFSLFANVTGGVYQNSLKSLYNLNHNTNPALAYGNTETAIDANAGFVVGPYKGCYLKIYGGYTSNDDYYVLGNYGKSDFFVPVSIDKWYAGAEAHLSYRNIVDFNAKYSVNPAEYRHERATGLAELLLTVRPIEKLTLGVGWDYAIGRKYYFCSHDGTLENQIINYQDNSLCNYSIVNLNAAYSITKNISAFVNLRNLTGHQNLVSPYLWSQKLGGLVGVSIIF